MYSEGWVDVAGSLLDADGRRVARDDHGGGDRNFRISRDVDAGAYYVRVHGSDSYGAAGTTGGYTLRVEFAARAPDLAVESATPSAAPAVGETFTLGVVVRNRGNAEAGTTTVRYYRSADDAISREDEEIGTGEVAALGGGESSEHSIEVTVEEAVSYGYGACVDAVDGESDTANNCSASRSDFELDAVAAPGGIAHANGLLYVPDWLDDKVYAYTTWGGRRAGADFDLDAEHGRSLRLAHANGLLYVENLYRSKVYAYTTAGERRPESDFDLTDGAPQRIAGMAHVDGLFYIVGTPRGGYKPEVYVYTTSGERRSGSEFDLGSEIVGARGIAHADGLLYVLSYVSRDRRYRAYAYTTSGARRCDRDFELEAGNSRPEGITYAGGRFYVLDWEYRYPASPGRVFVYTGEERGGEDDHGDDFDGATSVTIPSTTAGELEDGGDRDYFRLEAAEATTLTIETAGSTDTYGTLFDGDEASLETDDDGGPGTNFRVERDVQAGTHYVEVRGFGPSTTGSYELSVGTAGGPVPDP